jgi:hypothetical protein
MKLEDYLQEKLKEQKKKENFSEFEEGYFEAIHEIALLLNLRPEMHDKIVKVTKEQFLSSIVEIDHYDKNGDYSKSTIHIIRDMIENGEIKSLRVEVAEGMNTGGCYGYLDINGDDISIANYEFETPNYSQEGIGNDDFPGGTYNNFLEYITDGLFLYGESGGETYMGGTLGGHLWRKIYQQNKVDELFEQELLDYLNDKEIPLKLKYRQHHNT